MGKFSAEKPVPPGSALSGNQHRPSRRGQQSAFHSCGAAVLPRYRGFLIILGGFMETACRQLVAASLLVFTPPRRDGGASRLGTHRTKATT